MPIIILSVLLQVAFIVHIVRNGKNTTWIWIVMFLPLAGSIAYLLLEVLPGVTATRTTRKAASSVGDKIQPNRHLKKAAEQYSVSDSIDNTTALAEEMFEKGMFSEAKSLYKKALHGVHSDDPYLMFNLAKAKFALGEYQDVKNLLDDLIEKNPEFKNPDAHLLYARTLEQLECLPQALEEYEVLHGYYPGPEASYRYAILCRQLDDNETAYEVLAKIISKSKTAGKHYKSLHKEWIKKAKAEI